MTQEFLPPSMGKRPDTSSVINSQYSFKLQRKNGDWSLIELRVNDGNQDAVDPFRYYPNGDLVLRGMSPYGIGLGWLPDMLTDSGFELTLLKPEFSGNDRLVRLAYNYIPGKPSLLPMRPQKGVILLLPDRYWIVREFEITESPGALVKTTRRVLDYDYNHDIPLIRTSTTEYAARKSDGSGPPQASIDSVTCHFRREVASDEVFRLSAFGLPEPVGLMPEKKIGLWVWLLATGFLCVLIGLWLRVAVRRRIRRVAS